MSGKIVQFDRSWSRLDKVLTARRRIRRKVDAPAWLESQFGDGSAYTSTTGEIVPGCEIRFKRGRWRKVGDQTGYFREFEADEPKFRPYFKHRVTLAWLFVSGERLGCMRLVEYDARNLYNSEFYDLMDQVDSETEELATAIIHWPQMQTNVADFGDILHLCSVWQSPKLAASRLGEMALWSFLMPLLERSSILILKAFPFEYGGLVPKGAKSEIGFNRRHRAMMRMLERRLGVMHLPGDMGADGWMWRPSPRLKAICPMPTAEPHLNQDD